MMRRKEKNQYISYFVCGRKHTFERHLYGMEAVLSSSEKGNSSKERLREVVEGSKREEVNKQVMSPTSR